MKSSTERTTMLEKLKATLSPSATNIDALIDRLESDLAAAEAQLPAARAGLTDAMLSGGDGAKARATIATAERITADVRTSLRGAIERRVQLRAVADAKAAAEQLTRRRKERDEALALVDESDKLAQRMQDAISEFVAARNDLMAKRSAAAALVNQNFGAMDDPHGAALLPAHFDAFLAVDLGAAGMTAFGPAWSDPSQRRPLTTAERITSGSTLIRDKILRMVPR